MHTRYSGRRSPLKFDPEIEKAARSNRALQRNRKKTQLATPSGALNFEEVTLDSSSSESEQIEMEPPSPPKFSVVHEFGGTSKAQPSNQTQNPPKPDIPPQTTTQQPSPNIPEPNQPVTHNNSPPTDEDIVNWEDGYYHEDEFETRVRGYNNLFGGGNFNENQNDQQRRRMPHFRNQNNNNDGGYFFEPRNNDQQYRRQYMGNYNRRQQRGVESYFRPTIVQNPSPVVVPEWQGRHFEIRPQHLNIIPTFHGLPSEEPYTHLQEYAAICGTISGQGFTPDEVKLHLFQFSLKDKAKQWFISLPPGSIYTWDEMQQQFLNEYYPMSKTSEARSNINSFHQYPGELLHESFARFKEMLRLCPHHNFEKWDLVKIFCEGSKIQASANRRKPPSSGRAVHNVTTSQNNDRLEMIEKQMAMLMRGREGYFANVSQVEDICEECGNVGHTSDMCSGINGGLEEVNEAYGERRPYNMNSNVYHPGLRNHPNFRYGNSANQLNPNFQGSNQQGNYSHQYQQQGMNRPANYQRNYNQGPNQYSSSSQGQQNQQGQGRQAPQMADSVASQLLEEIKKMNQKFDQKFELQEKTNISLGKQIGQLAEQLANRVPGTLPSNTQVNPQHQMPRQNQASSSNAGVNEVRVLRSGKIYENPIKPPSSPIEGEVEDCTSDDDEHELEKTSLNENNFKNKEKTPLSKESENLNKTKDEDQSVENNTTPYPSALSQPIRKSVFGKRGPQSEDVWETFKQVKINLPLLDAIKQIPAYAKFLKDLCSHKRHHKLPKKVDLTAHVSAILSNPLPLKMKDPGAPLISIQIGEFKISKALLDLGASVNILPGSLYDQYDFGPLQKTDTTVVLADLSHKLPRGVLADVIVKVADFYYPVDFLVLDSECQYTDRQPNVILGRPFLATVNAQINCREGAVDFTFGNRKIRLNVFKHAPNAPINSDCFMADLIDGCVHSYTSRVISGDPLEQFLFDEQVNMDEDASMKQLQEEFVMGLEEDRPLWTHKVESLPDQIDSDLKSSLESSPQLELKTLPTHLKYVFLGKNNTLHVIIAADLLEDQEKALLKVLGKYKSAIGWTIADLKGISPSICMHRIITDSTTKPTRDAQRRLNPNMREVVKKEVLKWLDAGIVYPISDSDWVSPTQTVPKKAGIQIVKGEDGQQLVTRPVTGWRVCIDYRKLNAATSKDHFPLPFIDQIIEKLSGQKFYCFLDGYSGYNQIAIHPEDQRKTTFTCPYGTFAFRRMPFGLCNAPATFQRCMMSIFSDMVGESLEIFMDDFSIFGSTFENCLSQLENVLKRCTETNLVLSWEKSHFMVKEGVVLGHVISERGLEVDPAKVQVISTLPPPTNVKGVRSFLGHAGFYRRFIKDFSVISKPLCNLLSKDAPFVFDKDCLEAFNALKNQLITSPILQSPDWSLPFEIMCDASDYAVGAVLGQRVNKKPVAIYYASRTLSDAQLNYTTTEKELLAVVFAVDKFRSYIWGGKVIIYSDHSAIRYLMEKKDAKPRLIRWILLLQEFDFEIRDKKGCDNVVADHLSRIPNVNVESSDAISDKFPDEQLFSISNVPWFANLVNYLAVGKMPEHWSKQQRKHFLSQAKFYIWDEPDLFKIGPDQIIRRCVPDDEIQEVLTHAHSSACGGHLSGRKTGHRVLACGLFWPTIFHDSIIFAKQCLRCQQLGGISKRDQMPMNPILVVDIFDVWGIDFMGPFPTSFGYLYILVAVDYVSKWSYY
ncbi:hypothetical protein QVD17_26726 [Tagetes erecta]|uniref:RNA-directed DNA polymerase n=1 Tax=Tagetes erecta TaxID=13708 RepID=A0AAD8KAL6_TARER|nr:hypothetical protein QVD17_26726 [Tagetes erecta]